MSVFRSYFGGMTLLLVAVAGLFGAYLLHQWNRTPISSEQPLAPQTGDQGKNQLPINPLINRFRALPMASYSEITQRPLFVEGRVPPEKPNETVTNVVPALPLNLKLEGVAITPESRTAVITDLSTKELLRLREGMSHKDWQVVSVRKEAVVIKRGKQELELKLEIDADKTPGGVRPSVPFKRTPIGNRPFAVPNQ